MDELSCCTDCEEVGMDERDVVSGCPIEACGLEPEGPDIKIG